jgi:hypothetical protein
MRDERCQILGQPSFGSDPEIDARRNVSLPTPAGHEAGRRDEDHDHQRVVTLVPHRLS